MIDVEKGKYLESLSLPDRENLGLLMTAYLDVLQESNKSGALIVVGGSVKSETMGSKRKDIDFLPLVDGEKSFEDFRNLMNRLSKVTEFEVRYIDPIIDEEFNSPAILRHTGSAILEPKSGAPLEFIRLDSDEGWEEKIKRDIEEGEPLSVLVSLKK